MSIIETLDRPTLAGISRPLLYNPEDLRLLLATHQHIADEHGVTSPYWYHTGEAEAILDVQLRDNLRLRIGNVGAFGVGQMAALIQEQMVGYVDAGTMGKQFPRNDENAVRDLTSIMIDGFDPDRIVVAVMHEDKRGLMPIAGVQAHFGHGDYTLSQTVVLPDVKLNGHSRSSTLSTFQALKVPRATLEQSTYDDGSFLELFGDLQEKDVVCLSRLFRQDKPTATELKVSTSDLAWMCMAALGVGIQHHAARANRNIKLAVYDTHNGKIQGNLDEHFAMRLMAGEGIPQATPDVLETILRYHYGPENMGGFGNSVVTGYVSMAEYFRHGMAYLMEKHHIELPPLSRQLAR